MTTEIAMHKQILDKLSHMEKDMESIKKELDLIKGVVVDDAILTEKERKHLNESIDMIKKGNMKDFVTFERHLKSSY